MTELLQEAIKGYNLPFTILLIVIILYWGVALFGIVDIDDAGLDLDGVDGDGESSGGVFSSILKIMGLSDAPLILAISLFTIFIWGYNLIANFYLNSAGETCTAIIIILGSVIGAWITTRLLIQPLKPLMNLIKASEPVTEIIGAEGRVISASLDSEFGRVEIETEGKNLIVNAVISEGEEPLAKGGRVLVVSRKDDSDTYIVRSL